MIIWILIIVVLIFYKASFYKSGISLNHISKENTDAVRGIFILLVFASHFSQYVPAYTLPLDTMYWRIRIFLGQFVVCMFLFYSGYGVTLSLTEKGTAYQNAFLRRRVLNTLLIYDLSQVIFFLVQRGVDVSYPLKLYCLSMLAWESLGNDNWYIFIILVLYMISWLCGRFKKDNVSEVAKVFVGAMVVIQILISAKKGDWWYNTIICYPMGVAYYYIRPKVEQYLSRSVRYWACLLLCTVCFFLMHKIWNVNLLCYEVTAALFTVLILLLTMKFEVRNRALRLAGRHLNELFLTHRIPMILLGKIPFVKERVHLYFALSVLLAFLCAYLFGRLVDLLRGQPVTVKT